MKLTWGRTLALFPGSPPLPAKEGESLVHFVTGRHNLITWGWTKLGGHVQAFSSLLFSTLSSSAPRLMH